MRVLPEARMSRSNKRRRPAILRARVSPEEKKLAEKKARTMGSMSALFRAAVLGYTPPRLADRDVLVKQLGEWAALRAEVNKVGSNLNQIAHHLNAGRPGDRVGGALSAALEEYENAIRTLDELRLVNMQAMGLEREPRPADEEE
jgi:mobilization protein NikA